VRPVRHVVASLLVPALLGGAGALLAATTLGPAAPAYAATAPCVAVVVDARLAGGPLRTACAKGDPSSGLAALTKAGFSYAFLPQQPGEVCQIDAMPACTRTSTTTYWSYWHRAKGSSHWVYSTEGAATFDPAPGSTEAWVWQEGGKRQPPDLSFRSICPATTSSPSPSPSQPNTATPTATATATPMGATRATSGESTTSATAGATGHPRGGSMGTHSPTAPGPTAPGTTTPGTTTSSSGTTTSAAAAPRPQQASTSGPSWRGTAVALVAIALLAAGAVARFRRSGR
jgi:hypothetical protein